MTEATTLAVFKELQKYKTTVPLCVEVADVMFAILDSSGDGHIHEDEFMSMCMLMEASST